MNSKFAKIFFWEDIPRFYFLIFENENLAKKRKLYYVQCTLQFCCSFNFWLKYVFARDSNFLDQDLIRHENVT